MGTALHGPGEMVYPDLIPSFDQKNFYILDKGTFKLFKLNDASERIWETEMPTNVLNNIIALNDSIFGFAEFIPTKAALNIINIKSGNTISHIDFEDENGEASSKYNFGWSIGPNRKAVLFLARFKKIMIADIDDDGKLCNINWVEGDTTAPSENNFYSGICCGSRYFYLLNRQNIDLEAQEGNAIIEIFDYDANPVSKIELDIPAWMMMLDEANHQMILLSPLDDDFHTVSLNGNEV